MTEPMTSTTRPSKQRQPTFLQWLPWEKATIWGLFLIVVYTLRHFFFIIFMTFIVSYIMRSIIESIVRRLGKGQERPWLERVLAVACFALLLLGVYGLGSYFGPRLVAQGEALIGRLRRLDPQREFNAFLARTVGSYLFDQKYPNPTPGSDRYRADFELFKKEGHRHYREYTEFPGHVESIEGPFDAEFYSRHRRAVRADVEQMSTDANEFDDWLLANKAPQLDALVTAIEAQASGRGKRAAGASPDNSRDALLQTVLKLVRGNPEQLARYEREWKDELVTKRLEAFKETPTYRKEFEDYYRKEPGRLYPFETYRALKEAFSQGEAAFTQVLGEPQAEAENLAKLQDDFRIKMQAELAQEWWESPAAEGFRRQISEAINGLTNWAGQWLRSAIATAISIPVQLSLSFLLSFFITFDMPKLRRGVQRLRESRVRDFYEEIAPGLINFARLMGRAFEAQGVIALVNSFLTLLAIKLLGIENEIFLCAIVFLCSFIPVLGVVFSSIPIAVMALIQPGGSPWLAILAIAAILIVHFIETSVLNPKILGDMLHLHPVIVLAVLAIGEHFFGIWGLLLAVPVTVYIYRFVLLNEGIPGFIEPVRMSRFDVPTSIVSDTSVEHSSVIVSTTGT